MSPETSPERFTLRQEYFGGLVYDSQTANYELINPQEHDFLTDIARAENALFEQALQTNKALGERINVFKKFGFVEADETGRLSLVSLRIIPSPENLPDGILTAPIRVFDSYTRQCNFDCPQCYFSSNIFVEEERRTIDQTADIMRKFSEAGTMEWCFTGGEPLVHADLFDAIAIGKKFGMNVGIYTNGWWSEQTAEKVLNSGINELVISLEGQREVNDRRRKRGSYDKAIETFNRIAYHNQNRPDDRIKTTIATAVGRDNVRDIEFLVRLAARYGFNINFLPLKPSGRARKKLPKAMLSTREFMEFSRTVQRMREQPEIIESGIKITHKYKDLFCPTYEDKSGKPFPFNYSECGALTTAISMMPDGQVFTCPFVLEFDTAGKFVGPNMTEASVEEAWFHPNFENFRQAEKIGCTDCTYYMRQCRGACRATVLGYGGEIKDGKLIGEDPQCYASLMPNKE